MLIVLAVALSVILMTLLSLSWIGRWRAEQRGRLLASGFQQELVRRGLVPPFVLRT